MLDYVGKRISRITVVYQLGKYETRITEIGEVAKQTDKYLMFTKDSERSRLLKEQLSIKRNSSLVFPAVEVFCESKDKDKYLREIQKELAVINDELERHAQGLQDAYVIFSKSIKKKVGKKGRGC